jgi:hypothetical protein
VSELAEVELDEVELDEVELDAAADGGAAGLVDPIKLVIILIQSSLSCLSLGPKAFLPLRPSNALAGVGSIRSVLAAPGAPAAALSLSRTAAGLPRLA